MPLIGTKLEQARRMLAEAQTARARRMASLEYFCPSCGAQNFRFDPPMTRITLPCRRCRTWIDTKPPE